MKILPVGVVVELDSLLDTLAVTSCRNLLEELKDAFVDDGCNHLNERILLIEN